MHTANLFNLFTNLYVRKLLVLGCCLLPSPPVFGAAWDYNLQDPTEGPSSWYKSYPDCGGKRQSPIDISTSSAVFNGNLTNIVFKQLASPVALTYTLWNDGHSARVNVTNNAFSVSGAGLPSDYVVSQFHFHWGSVDSRGSEHLINGRSYPLEMHIVSYKTNNSTQSLGLPDGVAVVSVLFDIGEDENFAYQEIINFLDRIDEQGNTTSIVNFHFQDLLPKSTVNHEYWRYMGSLTTPPCSEAVIWTIFQKPIYISDEQMDTFRDLTSEHGALYNNYRPLQALNGRLVYTNALSTGSSVMFVSYHLHAAIMLFLLIGINML